MKKLVAALLAVMMALGVFAITAAADYEAIGYTEDANLQAGATLAQLFPYNHVRIHMGFAKHNARYFADIAAANPGLTFTVGPNDLFDIHPTTGVITFRAGPSSWWRGSPAVTINREGDAHRVVNVEAYYLWYEYFFLVFPLGILWIALINNGR